MPVIQVMPSGGGWDVVLDGLQWDTFATEDEASDAAHTHAREVGAEFRLCDEDGRIREKG
jgi:hypothetical protein